MEKDTASEIKADRTISRGEGEVVDFRTPQAHNVTIVNQAIQHMGLGNYQHKLFFTCGFGFFVDQMLVISVGLVLPQITKEWDVKYPNMIITSLYVGSLIGAVICGFAADLIGRRLVWQLSLFFVSIFTMVAAGSPNFTALAIFVGLQAIGAGGNQTQHSLRNTTVIP